MADKRTERLAAHGLTPETIAALDAGGHLPAPPITALPDPTATMPAAGAPDLSSVSSAPMLPGTESAAPTLDESVAQWRQTGAVPASSPFTLDQVMAKSALMDQEASKSPYASTLPQPAALPAATEAPPTDVVMAGGQPAPGGVQPVALPGIAGAGAPAAAPAGAPAGVGMAGAEIPAAPNLKAPDYAGLLAATTAQGEAEARAAEEKVKAYQQYQDNVRANDAAWKATQSEMQQMITAAREHARSKPMDEWSTGRRVMAALAIGLGAAGAALTGGRNSALDIINKSIDDEIASRRNYLGDLERTYGSAKDAHLAMRAGLLDALKLDIEQRGARSESDVVRAKSQVLGAQIGAERDKTENQLQQNRFTNNLERAKLEVEADKISATLSAKQAEFQQKYGELYVQGVGVMRNETAAKEASTFARTVDQVKRAAARLRTLRSRNPGGTFTNRDDIAEAESVAQELVGILRIPYTGPGALTDAEREALMKNVVGNPLSLFSRDNTVLTKLSTLERSMDGQMNSWRKQALIPESGMAQAGGPGGTGGKQFSSFQPAGGR